MRPDMYLALSPVAQALAARSMKAGVFQAFSFWRAVEPRRQKMLKDHDAHAEVSIPGDGMFRALCRDIFGHNPDPMGGGDERTSSSPLTLHQIS